MRSADLDITTVGGEDANNGEAGKRDHVGNSTEIILGGSGNDRLAGEVFDHSLNGGPGDDPLLPYTRHTDTLIGGAGDDTVSYEDIPSNHPVTIDLANNTVAHDAGTHSLDGVENAIGSPSNDLIIGDSGPNMLFGWYGDDRLQGRRQPFRPVRERPDVRRRRRRHHDGR